MNSVIDRLPGHHHCLSLTTVLQSQRKQNLVDRSITQDQAYVQCPSLPLIYTPHLIAFVFVRAAEERFIALCFRSSQ
jgi:hypothetical protein